MRGLVVSLAAMFASLTLMVAGSSLLGTLLSVRLSLEGFQPAAIGAVLVFHSIGFTLGSRYATRVIRRSGQIRAFAAFAAIGCVAVLAHPIYVTGVMWALLRLVVGFCAAGLIMILESWIAGRASNSNRGALLGIYQVVYFSAAALGQLLFGMSEPTAYPVFSLVAGLLVLSLVPLSLTREQAPMLGLVERLGVFELYRLSPGGMLGGLVAGVAVSAFLSLAPVYASNIGMSVSGVANYMLFAVLATMLVQWPLGKISDLWDRRQVLTAFAAISALTALAASVWGGGNRWLLYAATAPLFGIAGCLYPISLSMINDRMEEGNPVAASAGLLFVYGLGTCLGPILGALTMSGLGSGGLFLFLAVMLIGLAVFVAYRIRTSPDLPLHEQGRFVNVAAAAAAPPILELDPRTPPLPETDSY